MVVKGWVYFFGSPQSLMLLRDGEFSGYEFASCAMRNALDQLYHEKNRHLEGFNFNRIAFFSQTDLPA